MPAYYSISVFWKNNWAIFCQLVENSFVQVVPTFDIFYSSSKIQITTQITIFNFRLLRFRENVRQTATSHSQKHKIFVRRNFRVRNSKTQTSKHRFSKLFCKIEVSQRILNAGKFMKAHSHSNVSSVSVIYFVQSALSTFTLIQAVNSLIQMSNCSWYLNTKFMLPFNFIYYS